MFNKTAKKLFVSSLTLVFAAATAISSTYAWFTTQTTAKVSQIDINVTTGQGFEIRFGGTGTTEVPYTDSDYKQTLSKDDLIKAYPTIFESLTLNHVTMQKTVVEVEEDDDIVDDGMFILTDSESDKYAPATSNNEYIEFEIYFRGRGEYNIFLTTGTYGWSNGASMAAPDMFLGTVGYSAGVETYDDEEKTRFTARETTTLASGNPMYAFAADAARMSLKNKTGELVDVEVEGETTQVIEFPYNEPKVVKFTDGTAAGVVGVRDGYGDALKTNITSEAGVTPVVYSHRNYALEYYNFIKNTEEEVPSSDSNEGYFLEKAVLPSALTYKADEVEIRSLVTLSADYNPSGTNYKNTDPNVYYGRLEIRIWLEGWDADCFNAIFGDTLFVNLGFETKTSS